MWLVVLCHTCTSHKLLSKFLISGKILLNVSAVLVLVTETPSSLKLQCGFLGWVVGVFSPPTHRQKQKAVSNSVTLFWFLFINKTVR